MNGPAWSDSVTVLRSLTPYSSPGDSVECEVTLLDSYGASTSEVVVIVGNTAQSLAMSR